MLDRTAPSMMLAITTCWVPACTIHPRVSRRVLRNPSCALRPDTRSVDQATSLVHVATLPLVGWEGLQTAFEDSYPDELALHCMVVVQTGASVTMFDYLPEVPKSPLVAATLLAGRSVKGIIRERTLSRLPKKRCWLVAPSKTEQVVAFFCASALQISIRNWKS